MHEDEQEIPEKCLNCRKYLTGICPGCLEMVDYEDEEDEESIISLPENLRIAKNDIFSLLPHPSLN